MYKVYYITWKGAPDVFWLFANSQEEEAAWIASTIQGVQTIEKIEEDE